MVRFIAEQKFRSLPPSRRVRELERVARKVNEELRLYPEDVYCVAGLPNSLPKILEQYTENKKYKQSKDNKESLKNLHLLHRFVLECAINALNVLNHIKSRGIL